MIDKTPAVNAVNLRDYFAAAALQGYIAQDEGYNRHYEEMAKHAYRAADAMLEARKPKEQNP